MADIGIRRETKNRWERRAPLTPTHVNELVRDRGLSVKLEPSPLRIFPDEEYRAAGAVVDDGLTDCRVILGVKEVPLDRLLAGKPYLFFSHVIKGQDYNMPLLRRILDLKCTLIDYETITDRNGRRLIFFGRHAGYAGMVDALWALGQRTTAEGFESAFAAVKPSHQYRSVDDAADYLTAVVGRRIREIGVMPQLHPLIVGFTGGGNVSQGAQEIFDRLPTVEVAPDDLPTLANDPNLSRRAAYKVVFRRDQRRDFARHLPYLTVLIHGIYWDPAEPRLVTIDDLKRLWSGAEPPRLRVIADITCDIGGSIEATVRSTTPDDPVFVYEPDSGATPPGVAGRGPVILAVDNLPAEFPRDATEHFGDSLYPFLGPLARADFGVEFEHLTLPASIINAVVAHAGELAPRYRYLEDALRKAGA
ncbi:MAG: bifunctional lysine ketoglutarate reductase /saccharopine dehydrogenase family protein [Gemmatimonadales bacterium]